MDIYNGSVPQQTPHNVSTSIGPYSLSSVQHDLREMRLTVRHIYFVEKAPLKKEPSTQRHQNGQRRRKAVLSEQVCHLLNTNDPC